MADGSSGNLGGVLFEAGKTISDAGKQQAQQTAQTAFSSVTGSQKQLFSKPQGTTLPKPPPSQKPMPKLDQFGDLSKMFGGEGKSPFGPKKPPVPQTPQISQEEIEKMAAENKARDAEEIAKRQAELEAIKQQAHKKLHDEVYYSRIQNVGENSMEQTRQAKAQEEEKELQEKEQKEHTKKMDVLPGTPLFDNQHLSQPVNIAKQQAMTKTEANRGSTG